MCVFSTCFHHHHGKIVYCNCCWFAIENLQKKIEFSNQIDSSSSSSYMNWEQKKRRNGFFFWLHKMIVKMMMMMIINWKFFFVKMKWTNVKKMTHTHTHTFPTTKTLVGLDFLLLFPFYIDVSTLDIIFSFGKKPRYMMQNL